MKHYFYLVRGMNEFNPNSVVYSVSVGECMMEQTKCELLAQFCKDAGWYFAPVSQRADRALKNLADSVFGKSVYSPLCLRRQTISISEAYKRTVDDSWGAIEKAQVEKKAFFHHLSCFGVSFLPSSSRPSSSLLARSVSRKNLKPSERESLMSAMIGFGLILMVFLIAGRLEYLYG